MRFKMIAILSVVLISLAAALWFAKERGRDRAYSSYSEFLRQVRAGQVTSVIIDASKSRASRATGRLKDGGIMQSVLPADYRDAIAAMQDKLVDIEIRDASSGWLPLLGNATPFLLLLALWFFMLQRMRNGTRPGTSC